MQEFDPNKQEHSSQSLDELIRSMNETLAHADEVTRPEA